MYVSKLNSANPGCTSLASSSLNQMTHDRFIKMSSETLNDKNFISRLSYNRFKDNIMTQPDLSKRLSIDFMKKSIHPKSTYSINLSNQGLT